MDSSSIELGGIREEHIYSVYRSDEPSDLEPTAVANMVQLRDQSVQCSINWKKILHGLDFFINDILVILFSISDIILDILVCIQFYKNHQMEYFYISVAIFMIAQLTYSFLFVATWGKHLNASKQIIVFTLVIPFSQFVPVFTWVESFRFQWIDDRIISLGLVPTADPLTDNTQLDGASDNDQLWGYIQAKYQSHAGFLAEALAEAIPQCMLQTVAIISSGEAPILFIISILTSIVVISSKGYLISYSIHRVTFLFNFICIVADVFGLFAIISYLFDSNTGFDDPYNRIYVSLLLIGSGLLVVGGFCLVVFSMFDDHLKVRHYNHLQDEIADEVFYRLYVVRAVAWVLAIIPVCIVYLTTKLTLIPICVFKSLDPEHAQRWQFYNALYKFLSLYKTDVRVLVANKFFTQCDKEKYRLVASLSKYSINRDENGNLRSREDKLVQEQLALQDWLRRVGNFKTFSLRPTPQLAPQSGLEEGPNINHEVVLNTVEQETDEARARARLRRVLMNSELEARLSGTRKEFVKRSALFKMFLAYSELAEARELFRCSDKFILCAGVVFMVIGLLCVILFIPVFLVFVCYAMIYPIIQLSVSLAKNTAISSLSYALTLIYISLLVLLMCLGPVVYKFQSLRVDIVDIKHFPGIFYEISTIRELHKRFVHDIDTKAVDKWLDIRFGRDMVREIKSYIDGIYPMEMQNLP